jgi:hypothetical protein
LRGASPAPSPARPSAPSATPSAPPSATPIPRRTAPKTPAKRYSTPHHARALPAIAGDEDAASQQGARALRGMLGAAHFCCCCCCCRVVGRVEFCQCEINAKRPSPTIAPQCAAPQSPGTRFVLLLRLP